MSARKTPIVAIRMSEEAAEQLAKACRRANSMIRDAIYEDARKATSNEEMTLEWLDWASRWLLRDSARERVA